MEHIAIYVPAGMESAVDTELSAAWITEVKPNAERVISGKTIKNADWLSATGPKRLNGTAEGKYIGIWRQHLRYKDVGPLLQRLRDLGCKIAQGKNVSEIPDITRPKEDTIIS